MVWITHAVLHEIHARGLQILGRCFEWFDKVFIVCFILACIVFDKGLHHFKECHHVLAAVLRQFTPDKV